MKMKMLLVAIACVLALGLTAPTALADPIVTYGPGSQVATLVAYGPDTSQHDIDLALAPYGQALYKKNNGGSAEYAFADFYSANFVWNTTTGNGGTINWGGPDFITSNPVYLLVKDGKQTSGPPPYAWYLFDISGWDGKATINFNGFWLNKENATSHVTIYGTSVPDGGVTLVLLGGALVGLETLRRKFRV